MAVAGHVVEPALLTHNPEGQGVQVDEPAFVENVPSGQGFATVDPAGQNEPAGQTVHFLELLGTYPAGHSELPIHTSFRAPLAALLVVPPITRTDPSNRVTLLCPARAE